MVITYYVDNNNDVGIPVLPPPKMHDTQHIPDVSVKLGIMKVIKQNARTKQHQ